MTEHEVDRTLEAALQAHFALSEEQEDALWSRFAAKREAMQWQAFASALVLIHTTVYSISRVSTWFLGSHR